MSIELAEAKAETVKRLKQQNLTSQATIERLEKQIFQLKKEIIINEMAMRGLGHDSDGQPLEKKK